MSYFCHSSASASADDTTAIEQVECQIEVADGVVVERRSLLWLSAGAVTALLAGRAPLRGQNPTHRGAARQDQVPQGRAAPGLTFVQFLEEVLPLSRRLVDSKGADEESYLMIVAAALSRLREPGVPLRQAMQDFRQANGKSGERFPLSAVSMRLEPGGGFSHHDHLNYNGVILGLEGEVRIRNYDFQGAVPAIDSTETFQIRQTRDDLILPGRFSTLGSKRENIHDLVAGKDGARVLDVFTFLARDATSRYLSVEDKPRDAEARIYDAAWKPRRSR